MECPRLRLAAPRREQMTKEHDTMAKNQNNNVAPATQKTDPGAKKDALATALAQIEKQFGKGAVMKLGDNAAMQVDAI